MWVRGLKQRGVRSSITTYKSHPMWVRGLKLMSAILIIFRLRRTPCGCVD